MRKLFAILLTVAMLATMSMTAFAAEGSQTVNNDGDAVSITLTGKYESGTTAGEVISVGVAWGKMEFTYTEAGQRWDPEKHQTVTEGEAKWTADGNTITVTNHSNVKIAADFKFTAGSVGTGITGTFSSNSVTLERAAEGSALDSQKADVTFNITAGSISADTNDLGTITVTISKAS